MTIRRTAIGVLGATCLLITSQGCIAARQVIHNGLSYASGSADNDPLRSRMSDSEWRQYQAEEQHIAAADMDRQGR